ncbi:hypothetical protein [Streptomyces sp. NBC_00887]|nr:hypothetical protein OG844_12775 [Streptomyces sp. NBC_00887]
MHELTASLAGAQLQVDVAIVALVRSYPHCGPAVSGREELSYKP